MADTLTRTRDDPYGVDTGTGPTYTAPLTNTFLENPGEKLTRTRETIDVGTGLPVPTTSATPAASTEKVGSPLNTLYGVDSESYLTDDQRKLMRQIQGKFDASTNRRDRELARYGAPMLSSYAQDEAMARAIAAAQGLNYRPPETPVKETTTLPPSRTPTLTPPRAPGDSATPNRNTGAQTNAEWQRILSGLMSIAPLLFGKDAYGQFMNKGLIQTVKEALFGKDAAYMPDASFEAIVKTGVLPTDPSGQFILNPITGLPMIANPNAVSTDTGSSYGDPYGPGSGWGEDVWPTSTGGWEGGDWGAPTDTGGWEGGDWGVPDTSNWWDFSGGTGGDGVDLFGGV